MICQVKLDGSRTVTHRTCEWVNEKWVSETVIHWYYYLWELYDIRDCLNGKKELIEFHLQLWFIYCELDRLCNYRCALLMIARLDDKLSNQSHTEWLSGNISNLKVGDASSSPPESIDSHKIAGVHGWWVSSRMKDRSMVSCRPLPTTEHENIVDTMSNHLEYWLLYNSNNKIQFSSTSN